MKTRWAFLAVAVAFGLGNTYAQPPAAPQLPGATGIELHGSNETDPPRNPGKPQDPLVRTTTDRAASDPPPPAPGLRAAESDQTIRLRVGQGRIITTQGPIAEQGGVGLIAIGNPTIADFEVLPNPRMLRLVGLRPGITDLTLVTSDEKTHVFDLLVEYDLTLLQAVLNQSFPNALVRISQMGEHLVLEGQARDQRQVIAIEMAVRAFLDSQQTGGTARQSPAAAQFEEPIPEEVPAPDTDSMAAEDPSSMRALPELTPRSAAGSGAPAQIINLITLPGVQQVLLQVRVAELNRTGLREMGADMFFEWGEGNILGTRIAGATPSIRSTGATVTTPGASNGLTLGPNSTAFGIFPSARAEIILRALRENSVVRVLAEPNLVALSGHEASFLAGGEFPVPITQGGTGGVGGSITVQFKQFGVQLNFVPYILDDEVIRLEVRPEVSTIDEALGTTLVVGGDPVPGINTRRVHTTVELREGESLALAGLLQVVIDAQTSRIPGLGDLPYIGPLFSNTSHRRVEKELLVIVTPYLISPMSADCQLALPGDDLKDPNDLEFFLLNRIEGRTGNEFYSTTAWDDPWHLARLIKLQRSQVCGPFGFSSQAAQSPPAETMPPLITEPAGVLSR